MKRNTKPTITVAIPAYNEEKTIVRVVNAIKAQDKQNFILERICVYSDGSTDNTAKEVRKNFSDVEIHDFKKNKGKAVRLNQIVKSNNSDALILVDADIHFENNVVFSELVKKLTQKNQDKIGIVCAYHKSLANNSLIGKLAYFGFRIWDRARLTLGEKATRYYCEGGLMLLSRELAKQIVYPQNKHAGDDTYSFYFAISKGFKVLVSRKAIVYIDLPQSYKDYARQMKRFLTDPGMVQNRFSETLTGKYETITSRVKMESFVAEFLKSPLYGIGYIVLQLSVKLQMPFYSQGVSWKPIERK